MKECPSCHNETRNVYQCTNVWTCDHMYCDNCQELGYSIATLGLPIPCVQECPKCRSSHYKIISVEDDNHEESINGYTSSSEESDSSDQEETYSESSYDSSDYSGTSSEYIGTSSSSSGGFIPLLAVIGIVVLIFTVVSGHHGQSAPTVAEQTSTGPEHQTQQGPLVRPFVGTGLIGVPNQDQQPAGTAAVPSSSENDPGATRENALTMVLDSGNSKSIWTTSVYSYAPGGGGPGGGLDNDQLRIGGWGDEYWSLLQFDLSSAPKLADRATLQLYNEESNATPTPFDVYVIDQDWGWTTGDRLWWRDRPTEMHRILSVSAPQSNSWVSIDITDVFNNWQSGNPNFGIALRPLFTNNNFDQFRSSKYADETYRPRLSITVARQSR